MEKVGSLSVCIPTYNRPKLISRAINSVFEQTLKPHEIVVCDNSENRETEKVIQALTKKSRIPIKYIRHKKNIGIANNWNSLLMFATGKYVKFLNDDDVLMPNCLQAIKKSLESVGCEVGVITCAAEYVDDGLNIIKRDRGLSYHGRMNYFVGPRYVPYLWCYNAVPLRTPTHMAYNRLAAISIGGFKESLDYSRDVQLALEIASEFGVLVLDDVPLVRFYLHPGQDVRSISIETRLRDLVFTRKWALTKARERGFEVKEKALIGELYLREMLVMIKEKRVTDAMLAFNKFVLEGSAKSFICFINNNLYRLRDFSDLIYIME